jgi:hypothetical protein
VVGAAICFALLWFRAAAEKADRELISCGLWLVGFDPQIPTRNLNWISPFFNFPKTKTAFWFCFSQEDVDSSTWHREQRSPNPRQAQVRIGCLATPRQRDRERESINSLSK